MNNTTKKIGTSGFVTLKIANHDLLTRINNFLSKGYGDLSVTGSSKSQDGTIYLMLSSCYGGNSCQEQEIGFWLRKKFKELRDAKLVINGIIVSKL